MTRQSVVSTYLSIAVAFALASAVARDAGARSHQNEAVETTETLVPHELKRAASSGDPNASYVLGEFLAIHARHDHDFEEAERYLRFAAEHDHVGAQHRLGLFLLGDEEVDDRVFEGLYWLGSAASHGDAVAALLLGRLHQVGLYGVEVDLCLALDWYEVAEILGMNAPDHYLTEVRARSQEDC